MSGTFAGLKKAATGKDGDVKLSAYPKGRVSVLKNGQWGTLCGHYFWDNQHGASMICKQLGYSQGGTKYTAAGGTGPINAGNRKCDANNKNIYQCRRHRGETAGCNHNIDQGVECKGASPSTCTVKWNRCLVAESCAVQGSETWQRAGQPSSPQQEVVVRLPERLTATQEPRMDKARAHTRMGRATHGGVWTFKKSGLSSQSKW